jgi:hypothetical protein
MAIFISGQQNKNSIIYVYHILSISFYILQSSNLSGNERVAGQSRSRGLGSLGSRLEALERLGTLRWILAIVAPLMPQ